jgi:tetratricopeptide (TPR) repeat protein
MSQIEERSQAVRFYDQGVKAMNSKKFAEAEARFAQAVRNNPRFAEAHNYLGYPLVMEGPPNYLMALEHYNRAIQLKPNLAEAYEYRGMLLLKIDRKSDAEDVKSWAGCRAGAGNEKGKRSERICRETR